MIGAFHHIFRCLSTMYSQSGILHCFFKVFIDMLLPECGLSLTPLSSEAILVVPFLQIFRPSLDGRCTDAGGPLLLSEIPAMSVNTSRSSQEVSSLTDWSVLCSLFMSLLAWCSLLLGGLPASAALATLVLVGYGKCCRAPGCLPLWFLASRRENNEACFGAFKHSLRHRSHWEDVM
jgi:hypothetical protein